LSGTSSMSHLNDLLAPGGSILTGLPEVEREVFRWTRLRNIEDHIHTRHAAKASAVLGAEDAGAPTVLAANGFICVGTESGRVFVFDFKQSLKCVCGTPSSSERVIGSDLAFITHKLLAQAAGAVTAVALSHDHTFVASGHASGTILLYDLKNPNQPARTVMPTSMALVATGRQEGHLARSRIVSVGFVGARHTAIVSADENGLAFYHSLGKVLFVEAHDTLRILGRYPDDDAGNAVHGSGDITRNGIAALNSRVRRRRNARANGILALASLPLGTAQHGTDAYQVCAILTVAKVVVVGLKPSPKTWYRRLRENTSPPQQSSRWRGCMAWWPSMIEPGHQPPTKRGAHPPPATKPVLAYSWGGQISLLWAKEEKIKQKVTNPRNGKVSEVEVGSLAFEDGRTWHIGGNVQALQWLNANVGPSNHSRLVSTQY
jgi:vacuolar protein sorting-associated protein 8